MRRITVDEEAPRVAADVTLEHLLETYVRPVVTVEVLHKIMASADESARQHYGRGYVQGGREAI